MKALIDSATAKVLPWHPLNILKSNKNWNSIHWAHVINNGHREQITGDSSMESISEFRKIFLSSLFSFKNSWIYMKFVCNIILTLWIFVNLLYLLFAGQTSLYHLSTLNFLAGTEKKQKLLLVSFPLYYWLLNGKPFARIHLSTHPSIHPFTIKMANRILWHVVSIRGKKKKEQIKRAAHTQKNILDFWLHVHLLETGYGHTNGEKHMDHINLSPSVVLAVQHGSCWAHATWPIPTGMCSKCRTHTGVQRCRMQKNVECWNSIGDIVG